jgi:hypothetical protein
MDAERRYRQHGTPWYAFDAEGATDEVRGPGAQLSALFTWGHPCGPAPSHRHEAVVHIAHSVSFSSGAKGGRVFSWRIRL